MSVLQPLINLISLLAISVLVVVNVRRLLFTLTVLVARQRPGYPETALLEPYNWPSVLILIPCRNEEETVAELCASLGRLDYPADKRSIVLINDGSHDQTATQIERFIQGRVDWELLSLATNVGKASALNQALAQFPFGEIVYVFDADHRPEPEVLKRAVRCFADPRVAGVTGRTLPSNPLASPSAYYAAVENYINQMVTMRAKDRLGLAPALLGSNCGYRRSALTACGGFRDGAFSEDSDLTVRFYRAGYTIRFVPEALAYHQVPETIQGYLKQHIRWARGLNDVAHDHSADLVYSAHLPLLLRIELFLFAAGYLDRIALAGAVLLTALSLFDPNVFTFPWQILAIALFMPFAQIVAFFAEQRVPPAIWLRLPWVPVFFALDILGAARGMLDSLFKRKRVWTKTVRRTPMLREGDLHSDGVG
jgi:cellulose synthase/poly-beta-1,6-N-acetylglucosamine synthase-like glycosyltransferase